MSLYTMKKIILLSLLSAGVCAAADFTYPYAFRSGTSDLALSLSPSAPVSMGQVIGLDALTASLAQSIALKQDAATAATLAQIPTTLPASGGTASYLTDGTSSFSPSSFASALDGAKARSALQTGTSTVPGLVFTVSGTTFILSGTSVPYANNAGTAALLSGTITAAQVTGLAAVAYSGAYSALIGAPTTLPASGGTAATITGTLTSAHVATGTTASALAVGNDPRILNAMPGYFGTTCIFEGDSITAGWTSSGTTGYLDTVGCYPARFARSLQASGRLNVLNVAVPGATIVGGSGNTNDITDHYATNVYPHRPTANGGDGGATVFLFVMIGANDTRSQLAPAATLIAELAAYTTQAMADGFTVVLSTCPPNGWMSAPDWAAYNEAIRNGTVPRDFVWDAAEVLPNLTHPYYDDNLHPTAMGHALLANALISGWPNGWHVTPSPGGFYTPIYATSGTFGQLYSPSISTSGTVILSSPNRKFTSRKTVAFTAPSTGWYSVATEAGGLMMGEATITTGLPEYDHVAFHLFSPDGTPVLTQLATTTDTNRGVPKCRISTSGSTTAFDLYVNAGASVNVSFNPEFLSTAVANPSVGAVALGSQSVELSFVAARGISTSGILYGTTVSGSSVTGNSLTIGSTTTTDIDTIKRVTFTPTSTDWWRVYSSASNLFFGRARVDCRGIPDAAEIAWQCWANTTPIMTQLWASTNGGRFVTQARISSDGTGAALDFYCTSGKPVTVTFYGILPSRQSDVLATPVVAASPLGHAASVSFDGDVAIKTTGKVIVSSTVVLQ